MFVYMRKITLSYSDRNPRQIEWHRVCPSSAFDCAIWERIGFHRTEQSLPRQKAEAAAGRRKMRNTYPESEIV